MDRDQVVIPRDLEDVFVDTFLLDDVEPIRTQMPANWENSETNVIAGTRIDKYDSVAAGGPYRTLKDMLLAFYSNQQEFNNDPSRNQIKMNGVVQEVIGDDGIVLVIANIEYQNLPLSLYTLDSYINVFNDLEPTKLVTILKDGSLDAIFDIEFEIPFSGAPLHYWNSYFAGGHRKWRFVGEGEGWLIDKMGHRTGRARVNIHHECQTLQDDGSEECSKQIVQFHPVD